MAAVVTMLLGERLSAHSTQEVIRSLGTCYAVGTDTIGYAIHKPPVADHNTPDGGEDANFTAALKLYRKCFSKNFRFNIILSNGFVITWETLIPTSAAGNDPALQWANFVNNAFRGANWDCPAPPGVCNTNQYESTQHQLGTMFASAAGDKTGTLQSYLTATHTFHIGADGTSLDDQQRRGVSVAYGTYFNEVVKENGRWVIETRDLLLRRGVNIPQPLKAARVN